MKDKISEQFARQQVDFYERKARYTAREELYDEIVDEMTDLGCDVSYPNSLDFRVAGDKGMLTQCITVLRRHGYNTDEKPKEGTVGFSGFWHMRDKEGYILEDYLTIWFNFSSTVCHRVKVGTEMREVDVYEVRCDE